MVFVNSVQMQWKIVLDAVLQIPVHHAQLDSQQRRDVQFVRLDILEFHAQLVLLAII